MSEEKDERMDHVIKADGFDRTDFDVVFWRKDFFGKKENVALYQISSAVCVMEMDERMPMTQPLERRK